MGQLSKATQQNASASEELAATAEELSGQAGQLQDSVGFFKFEEAASTRSRGRAMDVAQTDNRRILPAAVAVPKLAHTTGSTRNFKPY